MAQFVYRVWVRLLPFQLLLIMSMIGLAVGVMGAMTISLLRGTVAPAPLPPAMQPQFQAPTALGQVFTPEVQHWKPYILKWAQEYEIDPNIIATIMQIESCGDFQAGSGMGAQGLFQVMPFHFDPGEDANDPDTNAKRAIAYIKQGLIQANGHVGLALAGYNGGLGMIDVGWAEWPEETRSYYIWGTQIYLDAIHGKSTADSEGLQSWLNAGGIGLCEQAAQRIAGTLMPPTPLPTAQPLPPG